MEMTIEEVTNVLKDTKKVMEAIQDLKNESEVLSFTLNPKSEIEDMIQKAVLITGFCDDFVRKIILTHIGKKVIILYWYVLFIGQWNVK